jgi:hypothetical protein
LATFRENDLRCLTSRSSRPKPFPLLLSFRFTSLTKKLFGRLLTGNTHEAAGTSHAPARSNRNKRAVGIELHKAGPTGGYFNEEFASTSKLSILNAGKREYEALILDLLGQNAVAYLETLK